MFRRPYKYVTKAEADACMAHCSKNYPMPYFMALEASSKALEILSEIENFAWLKLGCPTEFKEDSDMVLPEHQNTYRNVVEIHRYLSEYMRKFDDPKYDGHDELVLEYIRDLSNY